MKKQPLPRVMAVSFSYGYDCYRMTFVVVPSV